ncbi:microtubule-associated protein futsch-like [Fagus crenata]
MFLKYANPVYVYCEKCDTDAGNVKRKSDVSGVEAAVRVGRNIKDSCVVNLEDHPSFVVKELNNLLTLSRHETCILNDNDNCEIDQTDGVEEKRESSHNRDPKGMLSEKDKPSSRGETDMNAKEVIVTSKLSDGPGIVEPTKSGKEKRKKRKAEDSEHVKGSEHEISSAEPHKAVNGDHSTDDTKKEERTFSQTKGMEVSKIKTLSTSLLASGGETSDVNGDEVESLQQISKTQANAETMDEKMSKKSKKKQDAAAKNLLDLQTKDQDDNVGILEAYLKSWNSGALDRDATRGSVAYTLVLHHLSSFIFNSYSGDKLSLRNKLVKSLLHDCSHKQHHEGILLDGTIIAVKQLSSKSKQGSHEFVTEIGMISGLQHPNLVRLYGCFIEREELLLVYEYMENNSLALALYGPACVGIARGLAFLHEESTLKIVHRDIKTTNVLLDSDLNAKISDSENWAPHSWKSKKALQLPEYSDPDELGSVLNTLEAFPPIVFAGEARKLEERLAQAAFGEAFLLQGGDCAESFKEFNANNIRDSFRVLLQMGIVLTYGAQIPIIKVLSLGFCF